MITFFTFETFDIAISRKEELSKLRYHKNKKNSQRAHILQYQLLHNLAHLTFTTNKKTRYLLSFASKHIFTHFVQATS